MFVVSPYYLHKQGVKTKNVPTQGVLNSKNIGFPKSLNKEGF